MLFLLIILGIENILVGFLVYLIFKEFSKIEEKLEFHQNSREIYLIKKYYKNNKIIKQEKILKINGNQIEVL